MNNKTVREPRILLIKSDTPKILAEIWENDFPCERIDFNNNSKEANRERDLKNYDVMIIDASDNYIVEGTNEEYTVCARRINPHLLIIGTSAAGAYFQRDDLSRKLYDVQLPISIPWLRSSVDRIKKEIENKGFKFKNK